MNTGFSDPELNLRMDWNSLLSDDPELLFTRYSERYFPAADDLLRYLADFADRTGVRVEYGTEVVRISRADGVFTVRDGEGGGPGGPGGLSWRRASPDSTSPPHSGGSSSPSGMTPSTRTRRPSPTSGYWSSARGNSAFETADGLMEKAAVIHVAGPHSVKLAWKTHFVGHLRAVNNNFLDTYQLKSQNAVLDGTVESIEKAERGGFRVLLRYARTVEQLRELHYDRIIVCTGFRFDASVFDDTCRPGLVINDRFPPEQTSSFESVDVPDLFFAGTLMQQRDFKKSTNGFIHGFRYAVRACTASSAPATSIPPPGPPGRSPRRRRRSPTLHRPCQPFVGGAVAAVRVPRRCGRRGRRPGRVPGGGAPSTTSPTARWGGPPRTGSSWTWSTGSSTT